MLCAYIYVYYTHHIPLRPIIYLFVKSPSFDRPSVPGNSGEQAGALTVKKRSLRSRHQPSSG